MFNRNPYVEPMNIRVEGEDSMFAKIFEATRRASQALEGEKTSDGQVHVIISNFTRKEMDETRNIRWRDLSLKYDEPSEQCIFFFFLQIEIYGCQCMYAHV